MKYFSLVISTVLLVAAIVSPLSSARAAITDERITQFASHIDIQTDGSMTVTETITVQAAGQKINHGIYRDFPTVGYDRAGFRTIFPFEVTNVGRDGKSEPYWIESISNGKRVYIGDADVTLAPGLYTSGLYTYQLTYTTDRQLGFYSTHDELYWNVTGNEWSFPIDRATATVVLPGIMSDPNPIMTRTFGYTGPRGSTETATAIELGYDEQRQRTTVNFVVDRPLAINEGLTIVTGWPKGLVSAPLLGAG